MGDVVPMIGDDRLARAHGLRPHQWRCVLGASIEQEKANLSQSCRRQHAVRSRSLVLAIPKAEPWPLVDGDVVRKPE